MKEQITEEQAAYKLLCLVMESTQKQWPGIYNSLKSAYKSKFVISDKPKALGDLSLANIATVIKSLSNKLEEKRAGRICSWMLLHLDTPEFGEYSKSEIKKYLELLDRSDVLKCHPMGGVVQRLLARWLGKEHFDSFLDDHTYNGNISPLLIGHVGGILTKMLALNMFSWKQIEEENEILPTINPKIVGDYLS